MTAVGGGWGGSVRRPPRCLFWSRPARRSAPTAAARRGRPYADRAAAPVSLIWIDRRAVIGEPQSPRRYHKCRAATLADRRRGINSMRQKLLAQPWLRTGRHRLNTPRAREWTGLKSAATSACSTADGAWRPAAPAPGRGSARRRHWTGQKAAAELRLYRAVCHAEMGVLHIF